MGNKGTAVEVGAPTLVSPPGWSGGCIEAIFPPPHIICDPVYLAPLTPTCTNNTGTNKYKSVKTQILAGPWI